MYVDGSTGDLVWHPTFGQVGSHPVVVQIRDDRRGSSTRYFSVSAILSNGRPAITSAPVGPAAVDFPYHYEVTAADPDGESLWYSLDGASLERGATIDATTGVLHWIPDTTGSFPTAITVRDGLGGYDTQRFVLPVVDGNTPPHIVSAPEGPIFVDQLWTYQINAINIEDPAGLVFSLDDAAIEAGMAINVPSGTVTWTPRVTGTFTAVITVTDPDDDWDTQTLTLPVECDAAPGQLPTNEPANIVSTPTGPAMVGRAWEYLVRATDVDGDAIDMSLVSIVDASGANLAAGVTTTNVGNGQFRIRWTPPAGVAGPVRVSVSAEDGDGAGKLRRSTCRSCRTARRSSCEPSVRHRYAFRVPTSAFPQTSGFGLNHLSNHGVSRLAISRAM